MLSINRGRNEVDKEAIKTTESGWKYRKFVHKHSSREGTYVNLQSARHSSQHHIHDANVGGATVEQCGAVEQ
jgi:hypothetical protein